MDYRTTYATTRAPQLWKRYVLDTLQIITKGQVDHNLTQHLDEACTTGRIKLTFEEEK